MRQSAARSRFSLLRLLAGGEVRSGAALAALLGISRTRLRACLRSMAGLGVSARGVPGHGYRLERPLDLIDRTALGASLTRMPWPFRVEVVDECESTSSLLLARSLEDAPHCSVLACEHQTGGRGRQGNTWLSNVGDSLAFSLLWRFRRRVNELGGVGLAVAVACARALESLGLRGVGVKWPNDLMIGEAKLGGILVETVAGRRNGARAGKTLGGEGVVIGVGINVRGASRLSRRLGRPVADLAGAATRGKACGAVAQGARAAITGAVPDRTRLLACLLGEIAAAMKAFDRSGFAPFRPEWHARHDWQGRQVVLNVSGQPVAAGRALGVADDGALLIRSRAGIERYCAGEISLKRA
ncbi:MAG: biotin--[acetyl-CoA-carboxylase] ligase [Burkholderiales bacterium]|nr:biotin--[acetyl-CoA-carboxylase] ligase [Burkholderiales bacterium]